MKKLIGLAIFVAIVIIIGVAFFNLPQRIGLTESPAEKLLSATLNRKAATAMMADLQTAGVNTQGM